MGSVRCGLNQDDQEFRWRRTEGLHEQHIGDTLESSEREGGYVLGERGDAVSSGDVVEQQVIEEQLDLRMPQPWRGSRTDEMKSELEVCTTDRRGPGGEEFY